MKCTACQRDIADGSNFCPYCGNVQTTPAPQAPVTSAPDVLSPSLSTTQPGWGPSSDPQNAMPGGPSTIPSNKGTIALIMGIAGILLDLTGCCCLGIPSILGIGLGIAAFVVGGNELEDIRAGLVSSEGEGQAKAGRIMGMIGIPLGALMFLATVGIAIFGQLAK